MPDQITHPGMQPVVVAWARAFDRQDDEDYQSTHIPVWLGGNSDAALRRAVRLDDAGHSQRFTLGWMDEAAERLKAAAGRTPGDAHPGHH